MNDKICSQCGQPGQFQVRSDTGLLRNECKKCTALYKKKHRNKNKEHIAAIKSQYYQDNKESEKVRIAKWTKDNHSHVLTKKKEFYEKHKDVLRNKELKKRFGITLDQYEIMSKSQGGVCAICEKPESGLNNKNNAVRNLAVDHCHQTNKIRGLLCGNCNSALGMLQDSITLLENAIYYLRFHGKQ